MYETHGGGGGSHQQAQRRASLANVDGGLGVGYASFFLPAASPSSSPYAAVPALNLPHSWQQPASSQSWSSDFAAPVTPSLLPLPQNRPGGGVGGSGNPFSPVAAAAMLMAKAATREGTANTAGTGEGGTTTEEEGGGRSQLTPLEVLRNKIEERREGRR